MLVISCCRLFFGFFILNDAYMPINKTRPNYSRVSHESYDKNFSFFSNLWKDKAYTNFVHNCILLVICSVLFFCCANTNKIDLSTINKWVTLYFCHSVLIMSLFALRKAFIMLTLLFYSSWFWLISYWCLFSVVLVYIFRNYS